MPCHTEAFVKRLWILLATISTAVALVYGVAAYASVGQSSFTAKLDGYHEVPSLYTTGWGIVNIMISGDGRSITYELWYLNLEGDAAQAHIHFGIEGTNGGVMAFLCGGGGKPACPARAGTVRGVITTADIIGPADQGIERGNLEKAIHAIRAGAAYVNVHTSKYPAGEIRGQLK